VLTDPPPLKWSALEYGFRPEEERYGKKRHKYSFCRLTWVSEPQSRGNLQIDPVSLFNIVQEAGANADADAADG
jgi:hypothetical protein